MAGTTEGAEKVLKINSSSLVTPAEATPTHSIWLSNLDALGSRMSYTPTILLYKHNGDPDFFSTEALKTALEKVLISFYPYAGELGYNEDGRVELKCTGKGVVFVSASFNLTMEEFGDFTPRPDVSRIFLFELPAAQPPCPVANFQVTRFKCGGVCFGTALHHMMVDGASALYFINTWADVARGASHLSAIRLPFLDRSLLKPRSPPSIQCNHPEYDYYLKDTDSGSAPAVVTTSTVTLELSASQVTSLKSRCGGKLSTFSTVVAHAWRCACKARNLAPDQPTRFYMGGDIRSRLNPPLPPEFLGNAILLMRSESRAGATLVELGEAIELSKTRLTDEYIRSLIDYLATKEEVLRHTRPVLPSTDILAVNWLRLPLYDTDFGWGKPSYVHRAVAPNRGFFYVLRKLDGEKAGLLITATLEKECMDEFRRLFYDGLPITETSTGMTPLIGQ